MALARRRRFARREDLGLTAPEYAALEKLGTPERIQAFLTRLPANHEIDGESLLSVREVLRQRRAHCLEGAFVAAAALWVHGMPPLVMHLDCELSDYPHCIAVFRRGGLWGAISKTNGGVLRYRDPVYRTLRELAMSYFHEYCDRRGRHTLRSYSAPCDLRRFDPAEWVTNERMCWPVHDRLAALRHYPLVAARAARTLSRRDPFEARLAKIVQYPRPRRRRRAG